MTMTLRCTHCEQPMTIAPRKSGSRVTCPACGRDVTVPAPGATESAERSPARGPANSAVVQDSSATAARPRSEAGAAIATAPDRPRDSKRNPARPAATAASHAMAAAGDETALSRTAPSEPAGAAGAVWPRPIAPNSVMLPKSVVLAAILFALVALALAFFAGYLFGRQSSAPHAGSEPARVSAKPIAWRIPDFQLGAI